MTLLNERTVLAQEMANTMAQLNRLAWQHESFKGLKRSDFIFMASLAIIDGAHADGIKASDLSNYLKVTRAAVTHILNKLEKAGYVERTSDPSDRRIVLVRLTENGQQIMEISNAFFLETLNGLMAYLGEQDSHELVRLLSLALDYFREKRIPIFDKFIRET
jgi:DNA-binding MarR family transcriptional regulator